MFKKLAPAIAWEQRGWRGGFTNTLISVASFFLGVSYLHSVLILMHAYS
jgi:hypothetical protein